MKYRMSLIGAFSVLLAGCINLPQTKALVTPIGVIGVHSFAPQREAPPPDFQQRLAQQRASAKPDALKERS